VELRFRANDKIAVPIRQNRNYQRLQHLFAEGWMCRTFGLTPNLEVVAYLNAEKTILQRRNVLGIDVNAKRIAVTVLSPRGKVLYQTYFGEHVWVRRREIMKRRSTLQALADAGSTKAKKYLKRLKTREHNYVQTNLGQIVREIVGLAERFDADVAIEKLGRFNSKGKRFNRTVMRIPFRLFRSILEQRCFDHDVCLHVLDGYHTSKWCSRCGAVGNGHSNNYALFKCKCGLVVNSDRKASLAVAVKCLLERVPGERVQVSGRRVSVSGLVRPSETGDQHSVSEPPVDEKPTRFSGG